VLFPARRIRGTFYCDGGLRLNTPLLPALRLGASRVLVIGLRHRPSVEEEDRLARSRESTFLNPTYLAGKVLNALLLDRVEWDVMELRATNDVLRAGCEEFGTDYVDRLNRRLGERRTTPLRIVDDCFISPSADIGEIAGASLAQIGPAKGMRDRLTGIVMRIAARGTGADKDLLSYLLFDRTFTEVLLELGRQDARAAHDDLVRIFS
jgi:NTE family protein